MLFTQQLAAVHAFDHNNACNRGSAAFLPASQKKPASRYYYDCLPVEPKQPFAEARPSNKPSLHDTESSAALIMPCPKKAAVLCSNAFPGTNPVAATAPRWDPSSALDSRELEAPIVLVGNDDDDDAHYFDQAACAELMEIMSSSGSSRSSSGSSSPQSSFNGDVESVSPDFTVPFGLFEEYAAFFGSSPIVRANNPLPNDESFRPSHPEVANEVAEHLQSFLTRRHQAKVFDFNLNVDEDGEMQIPSRAKFNCGGVVF